MKAHVKIELHFDVGRHNRVLPDFDEGNSDMFFDMLDCIVKQISIDEHWGILSQSKLTGEALEVYVALPENGITYDEVKEEVLRAYEQIPEAHRKRFREYRKNTT